MYTSVTKKKTAQSTRSHGASKSCSFAKLKALRDDDDDDDKEDNNNKFPKHIDTAVVSFFCIILLAKYIRIKLWKYDITISL